MNDVDDAPELGARHGVRRIPLLVLIRDGKELDRLVGAVPESQIESWLRRHVDVAASSA